MKIGIDSYCLAKVGTGIWALTTLGQRIRPELGPHLDVA